MQTCLKNSNGGKIVLKIKKNKKILYLQVSNLFKQIIKFSNDSLSQFLKIEAKALFKLIVSSK